MGRSTRHGHGWWGNAILMNEQLWKTSVEIEELGGRQYVRVIEGGAVSVKGFRSRADAKTCAQDEQARLGLDTRLCT